MPGAEEPPDQGPRHVAGADEADFLHEPSPPTEEPGRLAPGPFTWIRTPGERPARPASAARAAARGAESTVCTRSKRPTAARTLLRWRAPIRCQAAGPETAARLARASWT